MNRSAAFLFRGRIALAVAALLCAIPLMTAEVRAGMNAWTYLGPRSQSINAFAVSAGTPGVIYAVGAVQDSEVDAFGASYQGVYKSTDGGGSWGLMGRIDVSVFILAVDRSTPETLYAATDGLGIRKSTDSGATWFAANTALPRAMTINSLVVDPVHPTTVYATVNAYQGKPFIFRSVDGGATWADPAAGRFTYSLSSGGLVIDPTAPNTLYTITHGNNPGTVSELYKSTDAGANWVRAGVGAV